MEVQKWVGDWLVELPPKLPRALTSLLLDHQFCSRIPGTTAKAIHTPHLSLTTIRPCRRFAPQLTLLIIT
ncbi:hypothetical protein BJX61DRAFT_66665 [Aspergillus egyptiacus]|nr:hypothetical protein BJX61DRAFT_66665 [Aspergillus egyptiacus]